MASAAELAVLLTLKDQTGGALGKMHGDLDNVEKKSGSLIGTFAKVGLAATAGFAVAGVGAIAGFVKAAMESQQIMAQTEAVIKSTGGAAGYSAQQIADMATQLSKTRPFDDEVIQSAENLLLTFTNIGHDVMPQATSAVLDMATALKEDTSTAAQQLGKALQDPIAGVSALQRVGVKLTEQQKEQVKAMVEAGDVAGAQAVILKELQTEFGGSAEAAGKTFAGSLTILKTQLGNVAEDIGARFIPILTHAATWMSKVLPGAIDVLMGWLDRLWSFLAGPLTTVWVAVRDSALTFIQALQGDWTDDSKITPLHRAIGMIGSVIHDTVLPALETLWDIIQTRIIPIFESAIGMVGGLIDAFGDGGIGGALSALPGIIEPHLKLVADLFLDLGNALIDWVEPMIPPLLEKLQALLVKVGDWVVNVGLPFLSEKLGEWIDAFNAWVQEAAPPLLEELGVLLGIIGNWIADTALPEILRNLDDWGIAIATFWLDHILPMLETLGKLLIAIETWMATVAYPAIGAKLLEWGQQFVDWIGPATTNMISALGPLLSSLGSWLIDTALPTIASHLLEWGLAFVQWVIPIWASLEIKVNELLLSLGNWVITTALPQLLTKVGEWELAFVNWAVDAAAELPGKLAGILSAIVGWVSDNGPSIAKSGADVAYNFLSGIAQYIYDNASGIVGAAIDYIRGLIPSFGDIVGALIPGGGNPFKDNRYVLGGGGGPPNPRPPVDLPGNMPISGRPPVDLPGNLPITGPNGPQGPHQPFVGNFVPNPLAGLGNLSNSGGVPSGGGSGRSAAHYQQVVNAGKRFADAIVNAVAAPVVAAAAASTPTYQGGSYTGQGGGNYIPGSPGAYAYAARTGGVVLSGSGLVGYANVGGDGHGIHIHMDGHKVGYLTGVRAVREARMQKSPIGC